jgi:hypothetical protein
MYHLELRKFPHVVCRFNQSEAQLRALVVPWTRQEWIEEGERKWNVNEATLTILEGPKLSMPDLAMGKGWRNAQKRSEDVTERVLGAVRRGAGQEQKQDGGALPGAGIVAGAGDGTGVEDGARTAPAPVAPTGDPRRQGRARDLDLLVDSLGLDLLSLLDDEPVAPSRVWAMAQERLGDGGEAVSAAEALALAERAVGSLLRRGLAVLRDDGGDDGDGPRGGEEQAGDGALAVDAPAPERQQMALAAIETWAAGGRQPVVIARKV